MPGKFTVSGALWSYLPDGDDADTELDLDALTAVTGRFVVAFDPSEPLPVEGGMMFIPPVEFTVLSDGEISFDGTNPGVELVAQDAAFGLDEPLRWVLHIDPFQLGGQTITPAVKQFDALDADETITLDELAASPGLWPVSIARGPIGLRGATGPTGPTGPTGGTGYGGPTGPTGATGAAGPGASASAPATAGDTGAAGTVAYDSSYIYVAVAEDTWMRADIATWP